MLTYCPQRLQRLRWRSKTGPPFPNLLGVCGDLFGCFLLVCPIQKGFTVLYLMGIVTDGGGVRGLASIIILKKIMKGVNANRASGTELEPWQVFDMIGGTSTGG